MTTPRRKACVECRQQKIRCDVEQHKVPHDPCGRCKKMGLECRILPTSTRNLRQTKAEMRRELEELRWNMRQGGPAGNESNYAGSTASPTMQMQDYSPHEHDSATYSHESGRTDESVSPNFGEGPPPRRDPNRGTIARSIDGYTLEPKLIEDCFSLYFKQYHPLFPVLDESLPPNDLYQLSPFLFWAVIVTGARRYPDDRVVLERVSQNIIPLAFSSMAKRQAPIPTIEGLLLLCIWRIPCNSMYKDMAHLMCGAAVHLSTQIGLHISGVGQDFARTPLKKDQSYEVIRARLWLSCVIQSIRTNVADGLPPTAESVLDCDERDRENMLPYIPADLQFLHKSYIVLLRAVVAITKLNVQSINVDVRALRSLIGIFDQQLLSLSQQSPREIDTLQLNCARIHVLAFHFFAHPTKYEPDKDSLSRLYSLCITVIQAATLLVSQSLYSFAMDRSVALSAFCILKLVRSPLAPLLDRVEGEKAYFLAAQFVKDVSLQQGDIFQRTSLIMTDLWNSSKIFQRRNGQIESLGVRLRTRLGMSISYDMFWYWREEFGKMANPYDNGDDPALPSGHGIRPSTPPREQSNRHTAKAPSLTMDSAFSRNNMLQQIPPVPMDPQLGVTKFDPNLVMPTDPALLSFDTPWDGSDSNGPPMMDQFPDYDWAAGFDFSNTQFPTVPMGPIGNPMANTMMANSVGNIRYTYGRDGRPIEIS